METTCAMVLIDKDGNILACHGTGKSIDCGYDFPKGMADEGESHFEAACRELEEETGLSIDKLKSGKLLASDYITDCGVYPHNKHKDIHIFICPVNGFPSLDDLKCTTFFQTKEGLSLPEVDTYRIIPKSERNKFNKVLHNKFEIIDDSIQTVWK